MTLEEFQNELRLGIPDPLPEPQPYDPTVNHAPKRKDILTPAEKKLAIRNALRYVPAKYHKMLAPEFNKYFIFIARYGKSTPNLHGPGKHNIWQFTEKGRVPGISGHVDLDKFDNGTTLRDILLH